MLSEQSRQSQKDALRTPLLPLAIFAASEASDGTRRPKRTPLDPKTVSQFVTGTKDGFLEN
eukprot:1155610-Amphidinium_carterae.1